VKTSLSRWFMKISEMRGDRGEPIGRPSWNWYILFLNFAEMKMPSLYVEPPKTPSHIKRTSKITNTRRYCQFHRDASVTECWCGMLSSATFPLLETPIGDANFNNLAFFSIPTWQHIICEQVCDQTVWGILLRRAFLVNRITQFISVD
jgi:hypothetical protein